jgi:hypothetical protein
MCIVVVDENVSKESDQSQNMYLWLHCVECSWEEIPGQVAFNVSRGVNIFYQLHRVSQIS